MRSALAAETVSIERFDVIPYALPFAEPYVTARGEIDRRELVLVRLQAGGETGLGEAVSMSLRGGESVERMVGDLLGCRPALEGARLASCPLDILGPAVAARLSPGALAAVELALLDLFGKCTGQPVWRLLGDIADAGQPRPVPCNATLSARSPRRLAEQAAEWAERGFATFKVKVGMEADVERIAAVRDVVGDGARIRVDANGAWDEFEAVQTLRRIEPFEIELAEQPVATLESMARVRGASNIPLAADESVNSADDARRAVLLGSCDLATVKLAKVGSLHAAFEIAHELPVYLSSALDGPVGIAAAAHAAQTLPRSGLASNLAHGLATGRLFSETIASRECTIGNGELRLSDGTGWGVEIDERALERHRLEI